MAGRAPEIRWSPVARADLAGILDWIAEDRPQAALDVRDRILAAVSRLGRLPRQGRSIPEFRVFGRTHLREIVVLPWRIFCQAQKKSIDIVAVIDGRRNVEDLLLRRLSRRRP